MACGPENIRRFRVDDTGRQIRVTAETRGLSETHYEPFTAADRLAVEMDIEGYLSDARVPAPPRGYNWALRLPPTVATEQEFWQAINRGLTAATPGAVHPTDIAAVIEQIVDALYGRD